MSNHSRKSFPHFNLHLHSKERLGLLLVICFPAQRPPPSEARTSALLAKLLPVSKLSGHCPDNLDKVSKVKPYHYL